jgi:hypothetical protein
MLCLGLMLLVGMHVLAPVAAAGSSHGVHRAFAPSFRYETRSDAAVVSDAFSLLSGGRDAYIEQHPLGSGVLFDGTSGRLTSVAPPSFCHADGQGPPRRRS